MQYDDAKIEDTVLALLGAFEFDNGRAWKRFHGVLAPNAKLRPLVVPQGPPAQAQAATEAAAAAECEVEPVQARPHRISWARLLKRVFDIDMQHCPDCGAGELKIIAAILERPVIEKIPTHLELDAQPPPKGRVGTTLSASGSTLGMRPMKCPASGAGPVEPAQRGDRAAKSKHFRPPRAGPGHSPWPCRGAFETPMLGYSAGAARQAQ